MSGLLSTLYTVGHSNHQAEDFVRMVQRHGVTAIVDVRSHPYSQHNPQFDRERFSALLARSGLAYYYLGDELGGRPRDPACYVDGRVEYDRVETSVPFREGVRRLLQLLREHTPALMCAEKDPLSCHRTLLVARRMASLDVRVVHILADGTLEEHEDTVGRMVREQRLPEYDLFRSREDIVAEAYARQAERIAYDVSRRRHRHTGREPGA